MNVLSSPRTARAGQGKLANVAAESRLPRPKPLIENLAMAFGVFVPFLGLIAAVVLLWGRGIGWLDVLLLLGFYFITILGITVGFHRMFTHRAMQGVAPLRLFLGIAGSMSAQGPVIEWCAMHRRHHQHSDREGDPHSPNLHGSGFAGVVRGMWHAHMGWLFSPEPAGLERSVADLLADPVLIFVDKYFWVWMLLGWALPGAIAGLVTHSWMGALSGFLWGGLVRTFLLHHVTWSVNSVCHVWGTRPFSGPDQSRNHAMFGIVAFGDGWHNNHHAFPTSARHGLKWWEIDFTWWVIVLLRQAGLVRNVRVPDGRAIRSRLRRADELDGTIEGPDAEATLPVTCSSKS